MKTTLTALAAVLLLAGCALLDKNATQEQKATDVRNIFYALGSVGTEVALLEKPGNRPAFETAYTNLNTLVVSERLTGTLLRQVVDVLPWKELKDPTAVAAVRGATTLFDATVGDRLNLLKDAYVKAAATGLRDGLRDALGKPAG